MNTSVAELFGLLGSIVVLAGVSIAVVNGGNTAKVIGAAGSAFTGAIKAATLR